MRSLLLSLVFLSLASTGIAADMPTGTAPEWMKYTTPGKGHQVFKDLTGRWSYTLQYWEKPGTEPKTTKGTSMAKMVMGGRFLEEEAKGTMMGQPFTGRGYTGFDAFGEKYQSVWFDSMSTAMMMSTGTAATNGMINFTGTISDPMAGVKESWFRTELKIVNKNFHTFTMFGKTPEGQEYKGMEIAYKRVN